MAKNKKLQNVGILAIFLFVAIMAVGDFFGLFAVNTYGGISQYYLSDATHAADVVDLTGSRNSAEIFSGCSDATHTLEIMGGGEVVTKTKSLGTLAYRPTLIPKYTFSDGSYTSAFSYLFYPKFAGDYTVKEYIACFGSKITDVQQITFRASARPSTYTPVKYCGNLGMNQKTRSCYYKTCEVQANGDWNWGSEKQSSSFCDYVPPIIPPIMPPACTPAWVTTEWSPCIEGISTRMATDNNNCANPSIPKPDTEKSCSLPPICMAQFNCPDGTSQTGCAPETACIGHTTVPDNNQIDPRQYCKDRGYDSYDASTNTCEKTGVTDFISKYKYLIAGTIIGLFAWIAWLMPYLAKRK